MLVLTDAHLSPALAPWLAATLGLEFKNLVDDEALRSRGANHGSIEDSIARIGLTLLRVLRKGLWLGEYLGHENGRTPEMRLPPAPASGFGEPEFSETDGPAHSAP